MESSGKRESRLERKIAVRRDRSKFKKSDLDKAQRAADLKPQVSGREGRVIAVRGLQIEVDDQGELFQCTLRGGLKKEVGRAKNLVAVGDVVIFEEVSKGEGAILGVKERYSVLSRTAAQGRQEQLIAANLDQVLITSSVVIPPLKPALIDRYIIAAERGGMEPVIVINKIDLLEGKEEEEILKQTERVYQALGVPLLKVSAETGAGMDQLKEAMKGKTSVFSGQSGVGKSSLINQLLGLDLPTSEVIEKRRKGAHTTSVAQLIRLEGGGWCIDTPGIKSFGVWNLSREEIEGYFAEIWEAGKECRFANCSHTHEPKCAVHTALEEGKISPVRYNSYCDLLQS